MHGLNPAQPLRQYGQQLWQTEDGLPQNTVHAIHQTRDGYLWLATDGGLVRFDGVEFVTYDRHTAPMLRSNLIGALAETADGTLWAATADGLLRRSKGALHVCGVQDGLPAGPITGVLAGSSDHVWAIAPEGLYYGAADAHRTLFTRVADVDRILTAQDGSPIVAAAPDGGLWLATQRGVALLRAGRVTGSLPVTAELLAADHSGGPDSLWIATMQGLLHEQHGVLTPVPLANAGTTPRGEPIRAMAVDAAGRLTLATAHHLGVLSDGQLQWKSASDGLPPGRILRLYSDRRGAMWIITEDAVVRYAEGNFEALHARSGSASVEDIYEDAEGDLWLGTDAGLLELRTQRFTTLTSQDGMPTDNVRTLLAANDRSLWVGTDGGGLAHMQGSLWQTFTTRQRLTSNTILSLAQKNDGSIAIGTPDGLDRLVGIKATMPDREIQDALPDDFVRSLLEDPRDDSLWIGTRRGLTHQTRGGVKTWTQRDGLGSDLVGALELDRQHADGLWIGTRGGLSHMEHGHVTTLTKRDGLPSDVVTALYQDGSGALWIGTNGGGLSVLRAGRLFMFPASSGLPEVIHAIVEDGRGDLWLASVTGIYRVKLQQLESPGSRPAAPLQVAAYGVADGMRIAECSSGHPAAVRTADGSLWFATLRGISMTDPELTEENSVPPPVAIQNVTIDDQPASFEERLQLSAGHTRLALHYAGLSFAAPARVAYRYRLTGFDPQWIDAGTRRIAYYTNIPPGRYTFQVLAANNDGVWNQTGASLEIRVLPHLYQTWWFRALVLLTCGALGLQIYRLRVRTVESRFDAVLAERTRIAREIHDTLAQDIVGISVQLELVSRLLGSSADAARAQLDAARSLVKSSLAEARSSIWNLRSGSDGADDLPSRMSKAVTQIASAGTARLTFEVKGTYRAASGALEDQLLRVAREAVNNAVRHAAANRIGVLLEYDTRAVELAIEDDGCGFAHQPTAFAGGGHFGLKGMQERADEMGGVLRVNSARGKGTRISVHVEIP